LREVAPGIDPASQILALMEFAPTLADVRPMPASCFLPA
jgi:acyl CoA:acetate/3-ketoacid CoA transferase